MLVTKISKTPSSPLRVLGATIVILATVLSAALLTSFLLNPWLFLEPWRFPPGHPGHLLGAGFAATLVVSGVGSLFMLAVTKRLWWILGLLIVGISVATLVLFGMAMGPGLH